MYAQCRKLYSPNINFDKSPNTVLYLLMVPVLGVDVCRARVVHSISGAPPKMGWAQFTVLSQTPCLAIHLLSTCV